MGSELKELHPPPQAERSRRARATLIVGLGDTGLSCARFLAARGERIVVTDSRRSPPQLAALRAALPEVELRLGGLDPQLAASAGRLVVSPGVPAEEPLLAAAAARGLPIIGDIELFVAAADAPIAAVTGSNGKSTVTSWLAAMLESAGRRVAAGGNLGPPALDLLGRARAPDFYVLELSSFQLERTSSLHAAAAVVLNIVPDHMDRHGDLERYTRAKARIYHDCRVAVVNRDDPRVLEVAAAVPRRISFGLDAPAPGEYGLADGWLMRGPQRLLERSEIRLPGKHNTANALAALAMAEALGVTGEGLRPALRAFSGLAHRTQVIARRLGVTWIDDSKGTNVGATAAALAGLSAPLILIAGGQGKGADFAPLAAAAAGRVREAILIGEDRERLARCLEAVCEIQRADSLEEAVQRAAACAGEGDTVLLSPACASFDMFSGYSERGRVFAAAVRELPA